MKLAIFLYSFLFALNIQANVTYSNGLSVEMKNTLKSDLVVLNQIDFRMAPDENTLKILSLTNLDSRNLENWLFERVNYLVEENIFSKFNLLFKKTLSVSKNNINYPIDSDLIINQNGHNRLLNLGSDSSSSTIMTNIGADLYQEGKTKKQLLIMKINNDKIEITGTRVGIIKVGDALFSDNFLINSFNKNAKVNAFARIATLFHEARHSDGHGKNLGFGHSECPRNHNYEGLLACDESLNGAYAIEKQMLLEFLKNCDEKTCNESDKEVLKLKIIDMNSRIIKRNKNGTESKFLDETPESI